MSGWGIDVSGVQRITEDIGTIADKLDDAAYIVGTNVEYAIYLEEGTSKMHPYPFMQPAIDKVMAEQADGLADDADSPEELVRDIANAIENEAKYFASDNVPPGPDERTTNLKNSIKAVRADELA